MLFDQPALYDSRVADVIIDAELRHVIRNVIVRADYDSRGHPAPYYSRYYMVAGMFSLLHLINTAAKRDSQYILVAFDRIILYKYHSNWKRSICNFLGLWYKGIDKMARHIEWLLVERKE